MFSPLRLSKNNDYVIRLLVLFILFICRPTAWPQRPEIYSQDIATLRTEVNGRQSAFPILPFQADSKLQVSFDQLSHNRRRYLYRIEHCDYLWKATKGIFEHEAIEANQPYTLITDVTPSQNTIQPYTHYRFSIPNAEVQPLLSGNYRLYIYEEHNIEQAVASVCFALYTTEVKLSARVKGDTDIDWNKAYQQLTISLEDQYIFSHDPNKEFHLVVLQNENWQNAVLAPPASQINGRQMFWHHQRELIFPAGNEYRHFEMLSTQQVGMHIDQLEWISPFYHVTLLPDTPQQYYLHIEDQDGISVVRTTDNLYSHTESDYSLYHFTLHTPQLQDSEIYIDGQWTTGSFNPIYKMTYDARNKCYRATLFLKQGYYSYRYVVRSPTSDSFITSPTEGDFYQSRNQYQVLIYHRSPAVRYDRLVGMIRIASSQ